MQNESNIERPYAVDVICPVGRGLRITLKNYSKSESDELMAKLQRNKTKFHINILIEMATHDYIIYPSEKVEEIQEGKWFGIN
jgi:hypothetical protein